MVSPGRGAPIAAKGEKFAHLSCTFIWLHGSMVFEQIEQLKKQYTDKYVQVDADAPELARFKGATGQVKTVNMSGRALVEFGEYHNNIGWYDIAFDYLKVVDKPEPKAPESKAEKKVNPAPTDKAKAPTATTAKKLSPLEMARMQGAAGAAKAPAPAKPAAEKPAAAAPAEGKKKMSVAEMLEAARSNKPAATAEAKAEAAPAAEKPAAAPAEKPAAAAGKVDKSKMSVSEMIAAARANKPAAAAPAAPKATAAAPPAAAPAAPAEVPPEAAAPEPEPEPEVAAPAAAKSAAGAVDKKSMSVADMIAWCREHDSK